MYDFDVYQGRSNNNETGFGVSSDVVDKLTSILPENDNYKVFADNFFTNLPLIEHLIDALRRGNHSTNQHV